MDISVDVVTAWMSRRDIFVDVVKAWWLRIDIVVRTWTKVFTHHPHWRYADHVHITPELRRYYACPVRITSYLRSHYALFSPRSHYDFFGHVQNLTKRSTLTVMDPVRHTTIEDRTAILLRSTRFQHALRAWWERCEIVLWCDWGFSCSLNKQYSWTIIMWRDFIHGANV